MVSTILLSLYWFYVIECFISAKHSYATLKFVDDIAPCVGSQCRYVPSTLRAHINLPNSKFPKVMATFFSIYLEEFSNPLKSHWFFAQLILYLIWESIWLKVIIVLFPFANLSHPVKHLQHSLLILKMILDLKYTSTVIL